MSSAASVLSVADRATLAAIEAWGEPDDARFWACLEPRWRKSLLAAQGTETRIEPAVVVERLKAEHVAQARLDLSRIHPSWWLRALKDEPVSIQRAVAGHVAAALRDPLCTGLSIEASELSPDRPPLPDALRAALALWGERLVGDLAERPEDPPVIVALTRLDLRDVTRLIHTSGLVKWALAWTSEPPNLRSRDRERFRHFRELLGEPSPRLKQLAKHDIAAHSRGMRHEENWLGLVTMARLLEAAETFRVRWALQHLPYTVAKFTRSLMRPGSRPESSLARWETIILRAAWTRLADEGRIRAPLGVFE